VVDLESNASDRGNMQLKNEDQILDQAFRKKIIDEMIYGEENINRKNCELRKHEIYRDMNKKWVVAALLREGFKETTVAQMENRGVNISICRKIVNKLAQTYSGGVVRLAMDEANQQSIDSLADEMDINTALKKSDRYRQLFKNTMLQVVPVRCRDEFETDGKEKYKLQAKVYAPWEYDVIEDAYDNTKPHVVILTDFPERNQFILDQADGSQGVRGGTVINFNRGDNTEQIIADSPSDNGTQYRTFIWWSPKYHFTTDIQGKIISEAESGPENPIQRLPFINITGDQDGHFWAEGGNDVVETSIVINKQLTDLNYITFCQGWGQLVVAARDIPKKLVGGPDNAFLFEIKDGDPTPQVFFATSNPPIQQWLETVKSTLALLLSTNNLSPRNIAGNLDAQNAASGIALMIEQSEVVSDLQDVQQLYQDKEPELWRIIMEWHSIFKEANSLVKDMQDIAPITNPDVILKFSSLKPMSSEKEKLEAIKMRDELGLNTKTELLRMDNPDLSEADAEEKAKKIREEAMANRDAFVPTPNDGPRPLVEAEKEEPADGENG
jgi:hypothetical protein